MSLTKPLRTVAQHYQLTTRSLREYLLQSGLLGKEFADPSPAEIKERARKIREEGYGDMPPWNEETYRNRWIGLRDGADGLL
jgi:hypothetical protein